MTLFAVVAVIWAAVGYVYANDRKAASATTFGLTVLGIGWFAVAVGVTVKLIRLKMRRRQSTDEASGPDDSSGTDD